MKRNCYIEMGAPVNAVRGADTVQSEDIEVDAGTLAEVTSTKLSFIKTWTSAGLFRENVRRVGKGGTGTYYLYRLKSCVETLNKIKAESFG